MLLIFPGMCIKASKPKGEKKFLAAPLALPLLSGTQRNVRYNSSVNCLRVRAPGQCCMRGNPES